MEELNSVFNAQELVNYADELRKTERLSLWEQLFPPEFAPSLELKWIKSSMRKIIQLELSALDAHASRRGRLGAERIITDMPFFREAMVLSELDRQELQNLLYDFANRKPEIDSILRRLYSEHAQLIMGAYANADIMAGMLVSSGKILIKAPDAAGAPQNYEYNYDDAAGTWKASNFTQLTGTNAWTEANRATSKPIIDIKATVDAQKQRGRKVSRLIMNTQTFNAFKDSDHTQKSIAPLGGFVKTQEAKELLLSEADALELVIYDNTYLDSEGKVVKVLPDSHVILTSEGPLGRMYFGPTPEIHEKMNKKGTLSNDIAISQMNGVNCVGVLTYQTPHPIALNTVVSAALLPSFEAMDSVAVLKVVE